MSIQVKRTDGVVTALDTLVNGAISSVKFVEGIGTIQRFHLPAGETSEIVRLDHHLTLNRKGTFTLSSTHEGQRKGDRCVRAGHIHFRPALMPHSSMWDGETEFTVIALNSTFIQTCASDLFKQDLSLVTFQPIIAKQDQLCWELGSRLDLAAYEEIQLPHSYIEEVVTLLAMHLLLISGNVTSQRAITPAALTQATLQQLYDYIEEHIGEDIRLNDLASLCGLSKYHFCRQFKKITGQTPHQHIIQRRLEAAKRLLAKRELTIGAISESLGFVNHSQFTAFFRRYIGVTPQTFRQGL